MKKSSGLKNTFFCKDKKSAMKRLNKLKEEDKFYKGKTVKLNKKQVKHISGWKTWKIVKKK